MSTRQETDSLGAIAVPAEHYWGAQTQRSITNFPFGQRMPLAIVHAFGQLKAACAEVNRDLGKLDANLCAEIGRRAARHIHENHAPAACAEAYWRILRIVHLGGSQ